MTTETLESLRHERDEARASVAALREALEELVTLKALKDQHDHGEMHLCGHEGRVDIDDYKRRKPLAWDAAKKNLSQTNPGARLLERLRCAEAVAKTRLAFEADWDNSGTSDEDKTRSCKLEAAYCSALADWRKLTETHDEPC